MQRLHLPFVTDEVSPERRILRTVFRAMCRSRAISLMVRPSAPRGGQVEQQELTGEPGFQRMKAMCRHRAHSLEFKRQVAHDYVAGETLHSLPNDMTCRGT